MVATLIQSKGVQDMKHAVMLTFVCAVLGAWSSTAGAEPYWYAYEGNDLPENEGWERHWGNWDGSHEGDGAIRTVENGILTMDSLFDAGVYDYARLSRPGQIDPAPGETFMMEWRVWVEQTTGEPGFDVTVGLGSDNAYQIGLGFYPDKVESEFEQIWIPVQPGMYHDYRVISTDMRNYTLYIDGNPAHVGHFWEGLYESYVGWGDGSLGVASRARWDYFRVGVVPEPGTLFMFLAILINGWFRQVVRHDN
jgi:hypothetical protein